ncbi:Hypothetical protein CINCED_3A005848 [Cinara cedri]|uniref:XTP/dITP diphosphatase n=1 Tax=Cinara cedri TaxID=506608 RepID=A0A5E4NFB0_9HEMI|nr:Hypothetical protein CINCED_3A005848 [Cinara cedri]
MNKWSWLMINILAFVQTIQLFNSIAYGTSLDYNLHQEEFILSPRKFHERQRRSSYAMSAALTRKKISFITGNEKKLQEVLQIFEKMYNGTLPFELSRMNVNLDELQGDRNFICKKKALQAFKIVKGPCIVEDTSLCFNALGGLPGPYVKWFTEAVGPSGLYRMLQGFNDKSATAVCTIAYVNQDGKVTIFSGETSGTIVNPTTEETFGWDSCFQPTGV